MDALRPDRSSRSGGARGTGSPRLALLTLRPLDALRADRPYGAGSAGRARGTDRSGGANRAGCADRSGGARRAGCSGRSGGADIGPPGAVVDVAVTAVVADARRADQIHDASWSRSRQRRRISDRAADGRRRALGALRTSLSGGAGWTD